MARKGRDAARGRWPSVVLAFLTMLFAVLAPAPKARAGGGGGAGVPPAPPALSIPASWYAIKPAASVDYLPASSSVTPGGHYTLTIPIDTPPARGMGPSLSFAYASTTANGLLGVGWSLGGLSEISRCRKTIAGSGANEAIHYTLTDDFCLDGQRLVLVNAGYAPTCQEYRTERDIFARIVGCGDTQSGPSSFRVWTKGGEILLYEGLHHFPQGGDPPGMADVIVAWPLRDAQDRSGNLVRYSYDVQPDSAAVGGMGYSYRPLEIEYTRKAAEPPLVKEEEPGLRKVVFEYESRADASNRYLGGVRYGLPGRLAAVSVIAPNPEDPEIVGRYELSYEESEATGRSLLTEIRRCDGEKSSEQACLWAKQFTWWQAQRPDFEDADVLTGQYLAPEVSFFAVLDANGDGRDDLLAQLGYAGVSDEEPEIYLLRGSSDADDHGFLPPILVNDPYAYPAMSFRYVDVATSRPADVDGDGSFELLAFVRPPHDVAPYEPGFQWFRWSDDKLAFEPFGAFLQAGGPSAAQLVDFEGDGRIDMLRAESAPAIPARWLLHTNVGGDLSAHEATDLWAFEPGRAVGLDLDGDGRGELFAVDPVDGLDPSHLVPLGVDDKGQFGALGASWVVPSQGPYSIPPTFADLNGDGLKDALYLFQDPKQARFNTGKGFLPPEPLDLPGQLIDTSVKDNGVRVADFDGDGREDLLSLEAVNEGGQRVMRLFLSRPGGFVTRELGVLSGYKAPQAGWATTKLGDFNGDGWLDVARMPAVTSQSEGGTTTGNIRINVLLQRAPGPGGAVSDLLYEVKDELGPAPRELVFYTTDWDAGSLGTSPPATACTYPQLCLRRGFPVVRMVGTTRIEPIATRWTMYDYEDPRADLRGRGFLGFGAVRAFDLQLRVQTRTTFDNHTRIGESYPFAGLPEHTTQIVPLYELPTDGAEWPPMPPSPLLGHVTSIRRTYSHHVLNGGATYFTPVTAWSRTEFETDVAITARSAEVLGPNGAEERRTEGTLIWDAFGNPVYDYAFTWGGSARLTQHTYDNLTADWHIGLLRQSLESAGAPGALPSPREVTFDYDDLGRLARTSVEPNDPTLRRRTVYKRNTDGLVEAIRESVSGEPIRATYFAYDDKERMFLRAAWNDLGHARQIVTHPALGLPVVTRDENGVQVRRRYDTFGRVLEILPDGGAAVAISYAADTRADPAHPHGLAITETSAGGATTTYVDERGRAKESATLAFDGQTIVHKTEVNAFGQPVRAYRPGFGAASPLFTETTFDTLGRVARVERPNGDMAETAYSMFEIIRWDFKQRPSILRLDQDGRVVESTRFLQLDHPITTRYEYGEFGFLTDVWDAKDNHTEILHDRLGRRTVLDDPDQGVSTYHYNGFGELRESDDNDPTTPPVVLERDVLGRVEKRTDADGTTVYQYDAPGALGKPWKLTSPDGVQTVFSYDTHGRPWKTAWTLATPGGSGLGDGTYEIEQGYDPHGRLAEIRYPEVPNCGGCARFTARYTYTPTDYLSTVKDARPGAEPLVLWEVAKRNADDRLVASGWAPAITAYGKEKPEEIRSYDPQLGRLEAIVTTATGGEIFHLDYSHDPNGNVTSRTDPVMGRTEIFDHDAMDRLKVWTLDAGDKHREQSFHYDDLDNLLTVNEGGAPVLEHTYGVLVPGAPKVKAHALETLSGAEPQSYHYDVRGRQIEGGNRGITWTEFDLPKQITNAGAATRFDYDAQGARVRKTRMEADLPVASTVTLGGLYERREDAQTLTVEHVFYVLGEGGPVAQIIHEEGGEETTRYLQQDGLGSIALVFDEVGTVHDRRFFEPFGQRIEADGGPFTDGMAGVELGFTGHRHDGELGLIDMRGRVYDPLQKHFLTPDPIIAAPLSSQDLNRYAYAWNNPLSVTDPTGLQDVPTEAPKEEEPAKEPPKDKLGPLIITPMGPDVPDPEPPKVTKSDAQGAAPPTGPNALPAPQQAPPAAEPKATPVEQEEGWASWRYHPVAQGLGGFVGGLGLGIVPFAGVGEGIAQQRGWTGGSTHHFNVGKAVGEITGGLFTFSAGVGGIVGGGAASATGAGAAVGVPAIVASAAVVTGGLANVAAGVANLQMALSSGGGNSAGGQQTKVTPSSKALGRALEAAGRARPPNSAAHHVVAGSAPGAAEARAVLSRLGIEINDAANGVFLPVSQHTSLHTSTYYGAVNEALQGVTTRAEAIDALQSIARQLQAGTFP